MKRLVYCVVLLFVSIGVLPVTPAPAQETVEDAALAAAPGLDIEQNDAVADFPNGITLTLEAETEDPIANLELLYRAPGIDTLSVELPSFDPGATALTIEHEIDLRAGELPPGIDVLYRWRITEDDGDIVETPEQTLLWSDDRYAWTHLSGPNVTVYTYDADPAFRQAILDTAERTIAKIGEAYGVAPEQPIRIWAYADKDDLYGALAPNSEPWIGGAAYPGLHTIMAILPPDGYGELGYYVPHEVSHQVLHQVTKNPFNGPPQWLDEGLAVYWQESGRDRFYTRALELAETGQAPPLRTLNGIFDYEREGATAAYAFSLSVVMYIIDTWGDEGISRLLATFPEGVTYEDAVLQGLGITFDELDRRWREDLLADAQQLGAAGSTRFGDGGPNSPTPGSTLGVDIAMAAETVILGLVILVAVVAGLVKVLRVRRQPVTDEDDVDGVRWGDWPAGLEPPGWQESLPGQRGW